MEEQTKHCPYCGEEIQATAKKCRYCGEWLDGEHESHNEPPKNEELADTNDEERKGWIEYFFIDTLFKHYADFNGVVGRKQFWLSYAWMSLFLVAIMSLEVLAAGNIFVKFASPSYLLTAVATLAVLVPFITACVRRLRDAGLHWAWMSLYAIPVISSFIVLFLITKDAQSKNETFICGLLAIISVLCLLAILSLFCVKGNAQCEKTKAKAVDIIVLIVCLLFTFGGTAKAAYDYNRVKGLSNFFDSLGKATEYDDTTLSADTTEFNTAAVDTAAADTAIPEI